MAVYLVMNVLTEALQDPSTPGLDNVKARMTQHLHGIVGPNIDVEKMPDIQHVGAVDDFYASFEWSEGGLVHDRIAVWIVGSPRIDKVIMPKEHVDDGYVEIQVPIEGETVLPQERAASLMSAFWERAYTEQNLAKAFTASVPCAETESVEESETLRAHMGDTGPRTKLGRKVEREWEHP